MKKELSIALGKITVNWFGQKNCSMTWAKELFIGLGIRTVYRSWKKNCTLVLAKELFIGWGKRTVHWSGQKNCSLVWTKELLIGLGKRTVHWFRQRNCSLVWAKEVFIGLDKLNPIGHCKMSLFATTMSRLVICIAQIDISYWYLRYEKVQQNRYQTTLQRQHIRSYHQRSAFTN